MVCGNGGGHEGRTDRHNAVRNELYYSMVKGLMHPRKEVNHLLENGEKPADLYISNWEIGKPAAIDVTVAAVFRNDTLNSTVIEPLQVANAAAKAKRSKFETKCEEKGIVFLPFAMDCLGGLEETCHAIVKEVGEYMAQRDRAKTASEEIRMLYQRLSVTLQRQNGAMFAVRAG
jgi:hypothetical protein